MKRTISVLPLVKNIILGLALFPLVALTVAIGMCFGVYKWIRGE